MAERGREGWLGCVMTGTLDSEDGLTEVFPLVSKSRNALPWANLGV